MIYLNPEETYDYEKIILPAIYNAQPGSRLYFRDFFSHIGRSASPRLARFLYEEITFRTSLNGIVRLKGSRMRDGIVRL